ncbi:hypothetical protein B0T21DRAFT_354834 [Apiosordaria backusii]|uniref:Uncharacterized protein n=1 Tax=Apiosordaria backusii TaxID=314023 RepID=A0AA40K6Y9_9PEZI|nr:hypothetical protein B0T21DRAFT_354834 [Apiosordaria backusii]
MRAEEWQIGEFRVIRRNPSPTFAYFFLLLYRKLSIFSLGFGFVLYVLVQSKLFAVRCVCLFCWWLCTVSSILPIEAPIEQLEHF